MTNDEQADDRGGSATASLDPTDRATPAPPQPRVPQRWCGTWPTSHSSRCTRPRPPCCATPPTPACSTTPTRSSASRRRASCWRGWASTAVSSRTRPRASARSSSQSTASRDGSSAPRRLTAAIRRCRRRPPRRTGARSARREDQRRVARVDGDEPRRQALGGEGLTPVARDPHDGRGDDDRPRVERRRRDVAHVGRAPT